MNPRGWIAVLLFSSVVSAQASRAGGEAIPADLRTLIEQYHADRGALSRFYSCLLYTSPSPRDS